MNRCRSVIARLIGVAGLARRDDHFAHLAEPKYTRFRVYLVELTFRPLCQSDITAIEFGIGPSHTLGVTIKEVKAIF